MERYSGKAEADKFASSNQNKMAGLASAPQKRCKYREANDIFIIIERIQL